MAIFLDTQDIADRFGDYIEELRAILVANNIRFGSPDNFFEFARRLQSDDLLPGDLSRMFESILDRERDEVPAKTILTIIAIAVGGPDVAETDHDLSKPVKRVVDFLIRSGHCSPIDSDDIDTARVRFNNDPLLRQTFDDSTKLIHSMAHLERNAARATSHFDSTEQPIGRMDPRTENIPSLITPPSNQPQALDAEPLHTNSPIEPPSTSSDLPLPNFVRQTSPQPREHLAWLFAFSTRLAAPPLLAAIAGVALLYISYPRSSAHTEIPQTVPDVAATITPINPPQATDTMASVDQPQNALTVVSIGHLAKPSPAKPFSTGSPKPRSLNSRNIAERTPGPVQSAPDLATQSSALHRHVETAETPQPRDATNVRRPTPSSPRTINVSSGVMAANLLSAAPPSYPKLASLTHMQGKVVMQAIISEDGTVQNLQVIQGHRLLRGAAKNAARTWRYRPYMVNGKPVEVATIVSVNFDLDH